ncbi:MAG: 50S ribosomal protein L25 [Candidatus Omnitrophica bacterium]|nr:50S ribosomal protein L25 [Candidatus Omnitrophota bacterium]
MAKATAAGQLELTVQPRTAIGTRAVKRLRAAGAVPGVVYGKTTAPVSVSVNARALVKVLHAKGGEHALVTLRVDGEKAWEQPALIHVVQHDPIDGRAVHVDFHTIVLTERLKVKVPVILKGEAVGVKQEGGVLEHFLREIEVECLPTDIPVGVDVDISAMKIGETVHVRDLTPPARAKIIADPDGTVAAIQKPKEEKPAEEAAAAPTEPEVLREKKEEPEAAAAEAKKAEAAEGKKEKEPKS